MSGLDLRAFVARSRALLDADPPTTRRETRNWIVDPFLERLGWDVHADACLTDVTVDGTNLEYVCTVDGTPAVLVAVEATDASLEKSRAIELVETMAWTGIDRAIYTDGRNYLLLARTTEVERLACQLDELPDHESTLAHYARSTLGQRLEGETRSNVARQLAIEQDSIVASIGDVITAATTSGEAYRPALESAAGRFVDQLIAEFGDDRLDPADELEAADASAVSIEYTEPGVTEDAPASDDDPSSPDSRPTQASTPSDESAPDGGEDRSGSSEATADPDGEYVVRFFNDRGSIGAVGHSSSAQALVAAAEYLFDRGLSGVSVPWHPDDDESRAILNESASHPDGTPMTAPAQLSNGLYLETGGNVADRAARVEALVERAGLRAMLSGDWE